MKNAILCLLIVIFLKTSYAQADKNDQSFKNTTLNASIDTAFDKTVDYLQANDMFILAMDKQAGFIQAKAFEKDRKILSAKLGERKIMNFILRPAANQTNVSLNVFVEEYRFSGHVPNGSYYFEDKGISKDKAFYQDILSALQHTVNP